MLLWNIAAKNSNEKEQMLAIMTILTITAILIIMFGTNNVCVGERIEEHIRS